MLGRMQISELILSPSAERCQEDFASSTTPGNRSTESYPFRWMDGDLRAFQDSAAIICQYYVGGMDTDASVLQGCSEYQVTYICRSSSLSLRTLGIATSY
jgi:hypothetical protein